MKRKEVKAERQSGAILTEDQVNRLGVLFDQFRGLAELLEARLLEVYNYHADSGAMTAIDVIKNHADDCDAILNGAYGQLPPEVLKVREQNIRARSHAESERQLLQFKETGKQS